MNLKSENLMPLSIEMKGMYHSQHIPKNLKCEFGMKTKFTSSKKNEIHPILHFCHAILLYLCKILFQV